jgi:hypothetical protein
MTASSHRRTPAACCCARQADGQPTHTGVGTECFAGTGNGCRRPWCTATRMLWLI